MRIGVIPFATAAIVCLPCAAMAQVLDAVGYLDVFTEQANWPSPEAVAQDLGSTGAATRLKALHLLGLTDEASHETVWEGGRPMPPRVVRPDQIELTYAALGEDATQQAVIAIFIRS
jgi:hypothetical protein